MARPTSLTAQLSQLRSVSAPVVGRGKPSLLYSPQEAAELDLATLRTLGSAGECTMHDGEHAANMCARNWLSCPDCRPTLPPAPPPCHAGCKQLASLDARFQPFRQTLFSEATLEFDRSSQPPAVVERLDASIAAFLRPLQQHFLHPAAFQALEYLVRRYR